MIHIKNLTYEFEFRLYLGLSCRDEFPNCESLFLIPQVNVLGLFTDLALDPLDESSCFD